MNHQRNPLGRLRWLILCPEAKFVSVLFGQRNGPGGEGFVRFALIENEQRISQGMRSLKKALTKLG